MKYTARIYIVNNKGVFEKTENKLIEKIWKELKEKPKAKPKKKKR